MASSPRVNWFWARYGTAAPPAPLTKTSTLAPPIPPPPPPPWPPRPPVPPAPVVAESGPVMESGSGEAVATVLDV